MGLINKIKCSQSLKFALVFASILAFSKAATAQDQMSTGENGVSAEYQCPAGWDKGSYPHTDILCVKEWNVMNTLVIIKDRQTGRIYRDEGYYCGNAGGWTGC